MRRWIRFTFIFLFAITLGLYTALQLDSVQEWAKERVIRAIEHETGAKVTTGSLTGAPPFLLGINNLECTHPDFGTIKIEYIDIMPSWPEILFGKLSMLWVGVHGVTVTLQETPTKKLQDIALPSFACTIHSLHLTDVLLPKPFYEPLLTNYFDQSSVDCLYSARASLSWQPRTKSGSFAISISPHIGDVSPLTVDIDCSATKETTTLYTLLEARKVVDGSPFIALPCDRVSLEATLTAKTDEVLRALSQDCAPICSGSWKLAATSREKTAKGLAPVTRLQAAGSIETTADASLVVATTGLSCQKIEASTGRTQEEAKSLSHVTEIPMPPKLEGRLKKTDDRLSVSLIATGDDKIPSCSFSLDQESASNGQVRFECSFLDGTKTLPIGISSNFTAEQGFKWHLSDIQLWLADHTLQGACDISLFPLQVAGSLKSRTKEAKGLAAFFGAEADALFIDASYNSKNAVPATITCSLDGLKTAESSCKKALFSLNGNKASLELWEQKLEAVTIDIARLETSYEHAEAKYALHIDGKTTYGPCRLDTAGAIGSTFFTIESFCALSGGHTIKNSAPVRISRDADGLHLYPFEFISETGMLLQGDALIANQSLLATVTWANLPLECFDPFLGDITLYGNISGHLELSGKKSDPKCMMSVASSQLYLWNPNKIDAAPLTASCELTIQQKMVELSGEIEGLSLKLPTLFTLKAPLDLNATEPLTGRIQAEFDSAILLSSYLDEDELVEGIIQLDAHLVGTRCRPAIQGSVTWNEGKLYIPCLGTLFSGIQASGKLQNNELLVESLTATDEKNGTFKATAKIEDLISDSIKYTVEGNAEHFATLSYDDLEASATGSITISGNKDFARFAGTFEVEDALFALSPTISKDLPKLDITYLGDQGILVPKTPFQFELDLALTMDKGFVRGMGLDSSWQGAATIQGKRNAIDVLGKIALTTGTLDFAGKSFALTKGSLEFFGDLYSKSKLYVLATNEVGSIHTQIVLQGPLEHPKILIQSNPAMSQKEILSWLLFNKSSSDISPIQGIQLGQALLKLKNTTGNPDVIEEIKQKLGIDRLDFGPSSTTRPQLNSSSEQILDSIPNEVSVQVGKYISDGVIVTLSKDVTNEVNRVGVEANLSDHITAQANVGDDSETELLLEWKLQY